MTRWLLGLALAFLWAPVLLMAGFAFSAARQPFIWGGFSWQWFLALAGNERLLGAAGVSLAVAAGSACIAVLAGGATGWVLARHGRFKGRTLFGGLAAAPLVLPEVVTGLALLLLFVALEQVTGWPRGRGVVTLLLAHASLGAAYVSVVVQARLAAMGRSLEEAAADLGASPFVVFRTITLPLMVPSLAAGWGLAFLLSFDDVVLASFTSGPGATTLPLLLFSQLRMGPTPEAHALAVVMLALAGLILAVWQLAWRCRTRVRARPRSPR